CFSIHSAVSARESGCSASRCVRPSMTRVTRPASSSIFRWREIVGFDTPRPRVASPTVAAPRLSRSTMSRRIGWERALNVSLAIVLTIYPARTLIRTTGGRDAGAHSGNPRGVASGAGRAARGGEGAHAAQRRAHEEAAGPPLGADREGVQLRNRRGDEV